MFFSVFHLCTCSWQYGRSTGAESMLPSFATQVVANPFLWAKLQDSVRRTPMFSEFATAASADAVPPARAAARSVADPAVRSRRLTGFAPQQLAPSAAAAVIRASTAAAVPASLEIVKEIQAIAAVVLGSAVADKASFSEAGIDSLGELWPHSCVKIIKKGISSGLKSAYSGRIAHVLWSRCLG